MLVEQLKNRNAEAFHLHLTDAEYNILKAVHREVLRLWLLWQTKVDTHQHPELLKAVYDLEDLGIAFEHYDRNRDEAILFTPNMVYLLTDGEYVFSTEAYELMNSKPVQELSEKLRKALFEASKQV